MGKIRSIITEEMDDYLKQRAKENREGRRGKPIIPRRPSHVGCEVPGCDNPADRVGYFLDLQYSLGYVCFGHSEA